MSYITVEQARARSRQEYRTAGNARNEIRKSASAPSDASFDVFLSHSFQDAEVVAGVKGFIEDQGLRVYVDWIVDSQTDRSKVTPATANILRGRMNHCQSLLYASSESATKSKWMPWELGYFDGRNSGRVAVVPIVEWEGATFRGQEYLGLYPYVQLIDFSDFGRQLGQDIDRDRALLLKSAVRGSFVRVLD